MIEVGVSFFFSKEKPRDKNNKPRSNDEDEEFIHILDGLLVIYFF